MLDELPVSARLRVSAAAREDLALLSELVQEENTHADLVHLEDGHALAVLPGFRASGLPDRLYRMALVGVAGRLNALARPGAVRVEGGRLLVDVVLPVVGPDATSTFWASLEPDGPALETTTRSEECSATVTIAVNLGVVAFSGDGPWRLVARCDRRPPLRRTRSGAAGRRGRPLQARHPAAPGDGRESP